MKTSGFYIDPSARFAAMPGSPTEVAALAVQCKCGWNRAVWRTDAPVTAETGIHCSKCGERMNDKIMAAVAQWEIESRSGTNSAQIARRIGS